jgi:hypothetical protein
MNEQLDPKRSLACSVRVHRKFEEGAREKMPCRTSHPKEEKTGEVAISPLAVSNVVPTIIRRAYEPASKFSKIARYIGVQ